MSFDLVDVAGVMAEDRVNDDDLAAVRSGDPAAFGHLVDRYRGDLRGALLSDARLVHRHAEDHVFEFGPIWLVALALPAFVFGPYTAAMTSTFGLSGLLAGRLPLHRPTVAAGIAALMAACGLTLALPSATWAVIAGQVMLAMLLATLSIHLSKLLHDVVPSPLLAAVRGGQRRRHPVGRVDSRGAGDHRRRRLRTDHPTRT